MKTMDQTKAEGGLAFPINDWPGMTLRDYFAGQALAGLCTVMDKERRDAISEGTLSGAYEVRAAYALADRMLEWRNKK